MSADYADPHFAQILEEMKHNRFFKLQQGWVKYVAGTSTQKKYSYSQYCALFNRFAATNDVVATLQHEPGKAMFVDWAGPTMQVLDTVTGETFKAYFFVASLPFSGLIFCKAFSDMKQHAWNEAHVNALEFIGGVVQMIVPDNAATATHRRKRGDKEVVVTKLYLLEVKGFGDITTTACLTVWSHQGRVHSEAAYASLAGANPIPASSGTSSATDSTASATGP